MPHGPLHNLMQWQRCQPDLRQPATTLQFTSLSFDVSFQELFATWITGGKLVLLLDVVRRDAQALLAYLAEHRVQRLYLPFVALNHLAETADDIAELALETIITAGEPLKLTVALKRFLRQTGCRLYNHYGPTESHVVTCYRLGNDPEQEYVLPPIGCPIANIQIHILDANHQPQPIGIPGELCIAGAGLARGYLNRPELTAEKFIELELFGETQRIYKTGDLARWRADGNLEYLGRMDYQVKLRGFRIELGEIEATLTQHETVKEAVVILSEREGNQSLAAYLTVHDDEFLLADLRAWLQHQLPDYMVPAHFTVLDQLPLTPNGKIDRQALPEPQAVETTEAIAPRSETERLLASLWSGILKVEVNRITANFFESGGHSLLATQLVSRIRDSFGIDMPLRTLFEYPVLGNLAAWLDQQQRGDTLPPIEPQAAGTPLVMSYAQQRLWFLTQLEGPSATYNMPAALELKGPLDIPALANTFATLIQRHQSLRLRFPAVNGEATVQEIAAYNPLVVSDLSQLSTDEQHTQVQRLAQEHATAPFDLATGPLWRVHLLTLGDQYSVLLFNMHHIISDGWSMAVLIRDWVDIYSAQGQTPELEPLPVQYTDYADWQSNWLQGDVLQRQLDYWTEQLGGTPGLLELPTDWPRPAVQSFRGAHLQTRLSAELTQQLKGLCQQQGATLFMTLLAAFKVLLYRYTGQHDILIGSPIANRTHSQTEPLIGFFVNTLVLRTQIPTRLGFTELLKHIRQTALEAYAHQYLPFEHLVEQLQPERRLSHSPLFQVMFVLQNTAPSDLSLPELDIRVLELDSPIAKFDLTLSAVEVEDHLEFVWEYATDLFRDERIQRLSEHFAILLQGLVNHPEADIHHLPLLTDAETQQLLQWNQTETAYPRDKTIVDLFEEQVAKTPDNLAVVLETQQLTYAELNRKANQLAHYLRTRNALDKSLMAICVERSLEMIIGLLGILKAGGTYVPLDPDYPPERLNYMLADSQAPLLLTQSHLQERLPTTDARIVYLDEAEVFDQQSDNNLEPVSGPEDLAYVIYTSGSTGKPKGVMCTHHGLCNLIYWHQQQFNVKETDQATLIAKVAFDASTWELWPYLTSGAAVHPIHFSSSIQELIEDLATRRISMTFLPTPILQSALSDEIAWPASVRMVLTGGDKLTNPPSKPLPFVLFNNYGPTENTVVTTSTPISEEYQSNVESPPIGRPIANIQVYILDTNHQPQPIGIPGELCIAGAGLARGYLNRPELTAEKFIELELFGETQRIYKTGDLARWRPDGNLEYLGRMDYQIKLRGFRIELGEIEATLTQHETVKEAVVILSEREGNQSLAAYLTVHDDELLLADLRAWLQHQLPDYMVPAHFTVLDQLPLTPNGKIDRQALPEPDMLADVAHYIAPRNDTELQLVHIWEAVLNTRPISVNANFFELGGHSLLAVKLISHIQQHFGCQLPLAVLFQSPTITQLAEQLQNDRPARQFQHLVPIQPKGELPPLYVLPGAGGHTLYFYALGQAVGQNQPLYGLEAPGLDGRSNIPDSVEEHAALLLTELRQHQPGGPYRLAGHSAGGRIAFELAWQLEQQGETVQQLIILDTTAPLLPQPLPYTSELDGLWIMVKSIEAVSAVSLDLNREDLATQADDENRYELVMQRLKQRGVFAPGTPVVELKQLVAVYQAMSRNFSIYNPSYQVRCPLVLVRPLEKLELPEEMSENTLDLLTRPDFGWQVFCTQSVQIIHTPGAHISMLIEPHVHTLADTLQSNLEISTG